MTKSISKVFLMVAVCSIFLFGMFALGACGKNNEDTTVFGNVTELYGFSALSTASFLAMSEPTATNFNTADTQPQDSDPNVDTIHKYINFLDGFLGNDNNMTVTTEQTNDTTYPTKMTIKITQLDGSTLDFVMQYQEKTQDNQNIRDPDDADEINTTLKGIMTIGSIEYTLQGSKEVDRDEIELEITATDPQGNRVIMSQESEKGERGFEYKYYLAGTSTPSEEFSLEIEHEKSEIEIELEIVKDGKPTLYNLEKDKNKINITYYEDNVLHTIEVNMVDQGGEKYYQYHVEQKTINKHMHHFD